MMEAEKYADILSLSRPEDPRRCRMTQADRAAQFAPFAALTGFDGVISETARLTEGRIELTEGRREELNAILWDLMERIHQQPPVRLTHFVPDKRKPGGAYVCTAGCVKKIDPIEGCISLTNGMVIPLVEIIEIEEVLL